MNHLVRLLVAIALLTAAIIPFGTVTAQSDDTLTVILAIPQLAAQNLNEDGFFDDGTDEITLYYGLMELDEAGEVVNSTMGEYQHSFTEDELVTDIPTLELTIAADHDVAVLLLIVERDSDSFQIDTYLETGDYDGGYGGTCCLVNAAEIVAALLTGGFDGGTLDEYGCECGDVLATLEYLFSNGNDDLFEPYTETYGAMSGLSTIEAVELTWWGLTNRAGYDLKYALAVG